MKKIIVFFIVFLLLISSAYAEDFEISGEDFFNETAASVIDGKLTLNPIELINLFLKNLFSEITATKTILKFIIIIAVASGIIRILSDSSHSTETADTAVLACFLLVTLSALKIFSYAAGYGAETVHSLCDFITKFEPIFMALLVSSGATVSAAAFTPVLSAGIYLVGLIIDKCILPIAYFSAILGIVNNIGGRIEIGTLTELLNSVSKWILAGVLTLFCAILSLYGFGTNAANNLTAKTLKFAVGSLVPVVGGILSDTVDTVLSGANLIKNAAGTAGMISVFVMTFIPTLKILVMMLLLKLSAAFVEPFSDKRITAVLLTTYESVKIIFSMVITASLLFIISIGIILISSGVSL